MLLFFGHKASASPKNKDANRPLRFAARGGAGLLQRQFSSAEAADFSAARPRKAGQWRLVLRVPRGLL